MYKGLIFDINGTVTDIWTDESGDDIYRVVANLLSYQGIDLSPDQFKRLYFELNKSQRRTSKEKYPEFDVLRIFREIVERFAPESLSKEKRRLLPAFLAEAFRAASRFRLELYPGVLEVLDGLKEEFQLAALSDGQAVWAFPELCAAGLAGYFDPVIISSDLGYRKPDRRTFAVILKKMRLKENEVIFVGNDMYRDVFGAGRLGIKTVFFKSNQGEQKSAGVEPDYIIYDFRQLPEAIRFLSAQ